MSFPTVRERLRQIAEYGLPHCIAKGNTLPRDGSGQAVGTPLDGRVQEVIIEAYPSSLDLNVGTTSLEKELFATGLARASGGLFGERDFLEYQQPGKPEFRYNHVECHGFYDPKTNVTHFFLMPTREQKIEK